MEDTFQILFVIAVIVFSVVQQLRKTNKAKSVGDDAAPTPEPWSQLEWEEEKREESISEEKMPKPDKQPKPFIQPRPTTASYRNTTATPEPTSPPPAPDEAEPEYAIHSAEEARRAVIYSEILQRKY